MPTFPVRNLAERGILRDLNPYDLGINAFSAGNNVRFANQKAQRAPVWRRIVDGITGNADPVFVTTLSPAAGFDTIFTASKNGQVQRFTGGTVTDVTAAGFVTANAEPQFTSTQLGDVLYLNRESHVPRYWNATNQKFENLPNWTATWRCKSLRAYKDFLVALGVTKGAVSYPSMVKWSNATLVGQVPSSWDETVIANNLAGENPLPETTSPLVDGLSLRNIFCLYTEDQVWAMEFLPNSRLVFSFRKLFQEGGAISRNCVVEIDGKHFVFGTKDIYIHDGTKKDSIADERVRDFIYTSMNVKLASRFFVTHNPNLNEVYFCYVSGDLDTTFKDPTRCNRAAVFNYVTGTWGFMDLPNVGSMSVANADAVATYTSVGTATWDSFGGTWYDQEDSYKTHVIGVAAPLSGRWATSKLLGLDPMDKGNLNYSLDPQTFSPAYVERTGIDLDELGSTLGQSKGISRIFPQVTIYRNVPLRIQVGASMTPSGNVTWGSPQAFNPNTQYKVDHRSAGRYLAVRFFLDDAADWEISGFDAEIVPNGRR